MTKIVHDNVLNNRFGNDTEYDQIELLHKNMN